jgi:protein-L-isoaspartate(D-aspartate) O-methyltransferase
MTRASALAEQLRPAIADESVLAAIASIPRERFVPAPERYRAYDNVALPIACDQTISQPLVVARMLETLELRPTDRVLDVGTGSGYHAALLALLADHVWTVERHPELSRAAHDAIAGLGLDNVTFIVGDGYLGLPEQAPFDAINVAAATGDRVPAALEDQLADGGRLVAPVGACDQHLILTRRHGNELTRTRLEAVRFVPLVRDSPTASA